MQIVYATLLLINSTINHVAVLLSWLVCFAFAITFTAFTYIVRYCSQLYRNWNTAM